MSEQNESIPPASTSTSDPAVHCAFKEMKRPEDLKPHPQNPNEHPASQLDVYRKIVEYQGFRRPVTVSRRSGFITRGHGLVQVAMLSGWKEVPVDYQEYPTEEAELADLLADNMLPKLAKVNAGKVQTIMVELTKLPTFDVKLTGITGKIEKIVDGLGGNASGSTKSLGQGANEPKSDVATVTLVFNPAAHAEFLSACEDLKKSMQIESLADLLLELVRAALPDPDAAGAMGG